MALRKLSLDDSLGVASSHFFKSGNLIRNGDDELVKIKNLLPENGPNKTNIEYDVSYDMGGKYRIHGYTYTDVLTKFIYLKVANDYLRNKIIIDCVQDQTITQEGENIFQNLKSQTVDKYKLKKNILEYDCVIFLPGGNIYDNIIDQNSILKLIERKNAKVKCHPLTPLTMLSKLKNIYGSNNIIEKKYSGHELLDKCKSLGFSYNSEMGIVGVIKEKELFHVGKNKERYTYSPIYNALFDEWEIGYFGEDDTYIKRLKCIFSSEYSGLISILHDNPKENIKKYFDHYKGYEHVSPKNINN